MCPNSARGGFLLQKSNMNVSGPVTRLWNPILCSYVSAHNTKSWQEGWFTVYPKMHFCFICYGLPKPALSSGQNSLVTDLVKWFASPSTLSLRVTHLWHVPLLRCADLNLHIPQNTVNRISCVLLPSNSQIQCGESSTQLHVSLLVP